MQRAFLTKGAISKSSFPPLPVHGVDTTVPSGPNPKEVGIDFLPLKPS